STPGSSAMEICSSSPSTCANTLPPREPTPTGEARPQYEHMFALSSPALEPFDDARPALTIALVRGVETDAVDDVAVAVEHLRRDLLGLAGHRERPEDLVVDELAHLRPLALLREPVEVSLEVAPAVQLEDPPVRRRRPVERDLLLRAAPRRLVLLLVGAGDHEHRSRQLEVAPLLAGPRPAPLERGHRDLAHVPLGREAVQQDPVGDLARDLGHALADGGEEHLRDAVRVGTGVEERRHEGVPVELAAEVELLAFVPARPDGAHREDELAHPLRRVRPRHREPLLDVRLDLAAEAQDEAALRVELEVVADHGRRH